MQTTTIPGNDMAPDTAAMPAHHDRHAGHSVAMFRDRFWLSLLLTVPVIVWSSDPQEWLGYTAPAFPGSAWIPPILGTIVFVYGGIPFLRGAVDELRDRTPGMMTLISLAILVAFVTSWASTLGWLDVEIWWELATLITIMLLGHWLEMRSIAQARGALAALAELLPDTAERVTADGTETVAVADVRVGDVVLVRPGGRIPVDGEVIDGAADVDESLITGESRPVPKEPGAAAIAGSVVAGGSLRVSVTAVGAQTTLSGIVRLVESAQASQSRAQALGDRAAALLFYVALVAGVATFVAWLLLGDPEGAVIRSATVLVIACPHALGLAIPLVVAISTALGARNGLLVKDRIALERARDVDTVIFDKTGTLTRGEPVLVEVAATDDGTEDNVLALAAAAEADAEHPLGRAIVAAARERGLPNSHVGRLRGAGRSWRPGRGRRSNGRRRWTRAATRRRPRAGSARRGVGPPGPDGAPRGRGRPHRRTPRGRGRGPTRVRGGGRRAPSARRARCDDHRRRAGSRRRGGPPARDRRGGGAGPAGRQGCGRASASRRAAGPWRWSATA